MSAAAASTPARRSPWLAGLLSLLIPGLGQIFSGATRRGLTILLATGTALGAVAWYRHPLWYIPLAALWLWQVWDASARPAGAPVVIPILLWLLIAYGIGWQATQIDMLALVRNSQRAGQILRPMLRPDFIERNAVTREADINVQVPCSPNPPPDTKTKNDIQVKLHPSCASVNQTITLTASGLWPNEPVNITWYTPIGSLGMLLSGQADAQGNLNLPILIQPIVQTASPNPDNPEIHRIALVQSRPIAGYKLSNAGGYIVQGIYETLALALLATTLGAILALPISFLAARNLMSGNPITFSIYVIMRTILNFVRSIEALILAIIFVIIVGLGPFPGMLAITLHTMAALGKLYSEVIEGIDPGPIEAVRATGATWLQVVRYAVVPQIVPPFTALTIYRWDINVRSSTIIGFVGGGGIGFFLWQWIVIGEYRAVSSAFIAIAVVVILMDFFSARVRERIG